jgi:DNA polymerase III gamma/tau subunit
VGDCAFGRGRIKMKNKIWYEKYRQKDIESLSLERPVKDKMREFIEDKEIPHLLFTGPPGSGKTTLALILIDCCASAKLELNGSSKDRGVEVIKTKVSEFARSMRRNKELKNIIFFDEADGLTRDSQRALKNTIERYSDNCRFIFAANDFGAIDEAIYSRCTHFVFESIPKPKIIKYCKQILQQENISFENKKDIQFIVNKFYPDIRSVLNNLQNCSIGGKLNIKNLLDIELNLEDLIKLIKKGEIGKIRNLWANTTNFNWLWKFLINDFIPNMKDNDAASASAITTAEYMYRDAIVVDREINATACIIDIMNNMELTIKF